ncbi:aldo/keto reductase family protein [Paraburkholderia xenovorans LB400]|uniref:Aldo/keto reductase n=1 Tax=Paraburkholderia xenovorans (strain LB400) TaxID=266265 RepID=Q13GG6_PARXL|nr:aldo/keto reductase [Paraburkholderia xenovorans]ABE36823.1 Putative aldo/keto reductase [Paraburkholderia xenovorans LB400]AIP35135.1 aldo/keto reductase family protein [Paraburkholderia xenovorans LB400]
MQHVLFGRAGLRVSELCLGSMIFGDPRELGASSDDSKAVFDRFAEAGGTFIDTADHYADGESERLVGQFVGADRDHFVISTKWSVARNGGVVCSGNSRRNMVRAVEASLRRLRTDRIDLYSLHVWDFTTPWDEVMRGLDDLVRAGKIVYAAVSDTPAWEISRASMMAELRGWSPFVGVQIEYSLGERTAERDLLPMAAELGLGVTAWSPLAGGALSGKYRGANGAAQRGRRDAAALPARLLNIADEVCAIAQEVGASPAQIALAWVRARTHGSPVVPIIGARNVTQLEDNLGCLQLRLEPAMQERLDAVSCIELGFPHDFLRTDYVRRLVHGGEEGSLRPRKPLPHPVAEIAMSSGVTKK